MSIDLSRSSTPSSLEDWDIVDCNSPQTHLTLDPPLKSCVDYLQQLNAAPQFFKTFKQKIDDANQIEGVEALKSELGSRLELLELTIKSLDSEMLILNKVQAQIEYKMKKVSDRIHAHKSSTPPQFRHLAILIFSFNNISQPLIDKTAKISSLLTLVCAFQHLFTDSQPSQKAVSNRFSLDEMHLNQSLSQYYKKLHFLEWSHYRHEMESIEKRILNQIQHLEKSIHVPNNEFLENHHHEKNHLLAALTIYQQQSAKLDQLFKGCIEENVQSNVKNALRAEITVKLIENLKAIAILNHASKVEYMSLMGNKKYAIAPVSTSQQYHSVAISRITEQTSIELTKLSRANEEIRLLKDKKIQEWKRSRQSYQEEFIQLNQAKMLLDWETI